MRTLFSAVFTRAQSFFSWKFTPVVFLVFFTNLASAQDQIFVHHTERKQNQLVDTSTNDNLQDFLRKGRFFGHARSFAMLTNNAEGLTDYFANAVGVGIGYETGIFKGFQLGISGYAIYHLGSSNLSNIDPLSNQPNRYELGLFDVEDPTNKNELDRLEDLYLKFNREKINIKIGKQHLRTPFINPQDGRMRPTLVEGLLVNIVPHLGWQLNAGLVNKLSPRSTVHWYDVGSSMGLYGVGVDANGIKSQYKGNLPQSLILFAGAERQFKKGKLKIWDQYVTRIFNSTLVQWDGALNCSGSGLGDWEYGLQWISQHALTPLGNENFGMSYFGESNQSNAFGAKLGVKMGSQSKFTLNYTRITAQGRYLMPREWGRDPFYTFMPRERNEGYGNLHAANLVFSKKFQRLPGMVADLSYGRFYLPDVKDFRLNKYGFPAYQQLNLDVRYSFGGFFRGLDLQCLAVFKDAIKTTYDLPKYEINKVNLSHFNLILNYHF